MGALAFHLQGQTSAILYLWCLEVLISPPFSVLRSNNRTLWTGRDGTLRFDKEVYGKNPTFPAGAHVQHLWAWIMFSTALLTCFCGG